MLLYMLLVLRLDQATTLAPLWADITLVSPSLLDIREHIILWQQLAFRVCRPETGRDPGSPTHCVALRAPDPALHAPDPGPRCQCTFITEQHPTPALLKGASRVAGGGGGGGKGRGGGEGCRGRQVEKSGASLGGAGASKVPGLLVLEVVGVLGGGAGGSHQLGARRAAGPRRGHQHAHRTSRH